MTAGPPLTTYLSLSDDCASVYVAMMLGGQRGGLRGHAAQRSSSAGPAS